jgi:hypothetical protein
LSYARTVAAPDTVEQEPHAGSVPSRRARLVTTSGTAVTVPTSTWHFERVASVHELAACVNHPSTNTVGSTVNASAARAFGEEPANPIATSPLDRADR